MSVFLVYASLEKIALSVLAPPRHHICVIVTPYGGNTLVKICKVIVTPYGGFTLVKLCSVIVTPYGGNTTLIKLCSVIVTPYGGNTSSGKAMQCNCAAVWW